jgi:hypothetical protein
MTTPSEESIKSKESYKKFSEHFFWLRDLLGEKYVASPYESIIYINPGPHPIFYGWLETERKQDGEKYATVEARIDRTREVLAQGAETNGMTG